MKTTYLSEKEVRKFSKTELLGILEELYAVKSDFCTVQVHEQNDKWYLYGIFEMSAYMFENYENSGGQWVYRKPQYWINLIKEVIKMSSTNNIKKILDSQGKSIYALSQYIDMSYPNTHKLVNREDLGTTKLETLLKVAEFLDIDIEKLYKNN